MIGVVWLGQDVVCLQLRLQHHGSRVPSFAHSPRLPGPATREGGRAPSALV